MEERIQVEIGKGFHDSRQADFRVQGAIGKS